MPPTKTQAEVDKLLAERDFYRQNASVAEQLAAQEELTLRVRLRAEQEVLARDVHHHVYVFDDTVHEDSVKLCIDQLNTWSRNSPDGEPCEIELQISSDGGDIVSGFKLIDYLRLLRGRGHVVTGVVFGYAASMAAVLLCACDNRVMGENSFILLHEGSVSASGDSGHVEDMMSLYNKMKERIVVLLTDRSKLTPATLKKRWSRRDWWMDADEALDLGLVDEIR